MLIVGTRAHLEDLDRSYTYAQDVAVTTVAVGTFFGGVGSLLPGGPRPTWALLDAQRIVSLEEFDITPLVRLPQASAQSMAAVHEGMLLVGLQGAHLIMVSPQGGTAQLASFDQVEGRDGWANPAGPSPDLRSIAVSESGWFVNVHVGGVWRSTDQGESWKCVIAPESDVHEIVDRRGWFCRSRRRDRLRVEHRRRRQLAVDHRRSARRLRPRSGTGRGYGFRHHLDWAGYDRRAALPGSPG